MMSLFQVLAKCPNLIRLKYISSVSTPEDIREDHLQVIANNTSPYTNRLKSLAISQHPTSSTSPIIHQKSLESAFR
jgi:hypothetical protein